jgi:glycosyltransferase involved in cell wall biosynthesis
MKILFLSRYDRLGASSRLRALQFIPYLNSLGFVITVAPFFGDDYVTSIYYGKVSVFGVIRSYFNRIHWMLRAREFDLVWVEKEMLPLLPSWIELGLIPSDVPMVTDYDDAVFHNYDQHRRALVRWFLSGKIATIMRRADLVIAGNEYLAMYAKKAGARWVEILPTVVDVNRYAPLQTISYSRVTVGWIGSPNTARYLNFLSPVLQRIIAEHNIRVIAVGANVGQLSGLPIEFISWSEETEVADIQQFDIGIMPLPDEQFERGKCGYKLIQYMACGKPVIASPVGVNTVIVQEGINGFLASSVEEWEKCLTLLCTDVKLRQHLGKAGRERVEAEYSLQVVAPRLAQLLSLTKK